MTGLFLNVPNSTGLINYFLSQIKFYLLLISDLCIIYMLYLGLKSLFDSFEHGDNDNTPNIRNYEKSSAGISRALRQLLVTLFFILVELFFAVNLGLYLFFSFEREFISFGMIIGFYLAAYFLFRDADPFPSNKWHERIYVFSILFLTLGLPFSCLIFLYYDFPRTNIAALIYLLVSLIIPFLIIQWLLFKKVI